MVEPFPESFDASVSAWQWPGAYPYAAADSAYTNFLACLKALYIGVSILILFLSCGSQGCAASIDFKI